MHKTIYEDIADEIASYALDSAGDIQRHIIAPAILNMIGPVEGKNILDLYCGAGYLSRRLASLGANVTAVDSSEQLIGIAKEIEKNENNGIRYAVAHSTDLTVIDDSTFDDMICNMGVMLIRDFNGTVAELARLVKMGGRFIFSIVHPCFCTPDAAWAGDEDGNLPYKTIGSYFTEGWWSSEFAAGFRDGKPKVKHRTISSIVNALSARGFNVRRIVEPRPAPEVTVIKPHLEIYNRLPVVMVVEAIFPYL